MITITIYMYHHGSGFRVTGGIKFSLRFKPERHYLQGREDDWN